MSGSYDAIIVGAGPAGLSAALVLGRSCRRVLLCGAGRHRNSTSRAVHGFLSRDGIDPRELLRIAREQLGRYETVEIANVQVTDVLREGGRFIVQLHDGSRLSARKVLLATGLIDILPDIRCLGEFYGRSIFHCPYCDGWEFRHRPLAVYGRGSDAPELALELTGWSADLTVVTDGPVEFSAGDRARLARHGIGILEHRIARLEGCDGMLERIVFDDGSAHECRAMFFNLGHRQCSDLAARLGAKLDPGSDTVVGNRHQATNVPGLYVAGDAAFHTHFAIIAASEGAIAAFAINSALLREDRERRNEG